MLKIRLQRIGRKHEPVFRVVLTDSKNSTKSGKTHEVLGNFDARRGEKAVLKDDRIKYWLSQGAQATGTIHNMLVSRKVISGKKINVLPKKKAIISEKPVEESKPAPVTEAPAETVTEAPAQAPEAPAENTEVAA